MNVVRIPWSAVLPWSVVLDPFGVPAVVLPPQRIGVLTLAYRDGLMWHYETPNGFATVLEPELSEAVRNLLNHFTLTEVPDG